jgi:hypothetical protein
LDLWRQDQNAWHPGLPDTCGQFGIRLDLLGFVVQYPRK